MYPAFQGTIKGGKFSIADLDGRETMLEGKHLIVLPLSLNAKKKVTGGDVLAGIYKNGKLTLADGKTADLGKFDGASVMVLIRHELVARFAAVAADAFGEKYQLGAKLGDLDN